MKDVNATNQNADDEDAVSLIVHVGDASKNPSEAAKDIDKEDTCNEGMKTALAK